jgi:DNA-binding MarR family transcriptional regulator
MIDKKTDLALLKAIIKAELTPSDIRIVVYFMAQPSKTVTTRHQDIASHLNMKQANFARSLKKLVANNVISIKRTGLFLRSKTQWKTEKTGENL